ncbi:MAG: outer membrane beta-barrel protein [Ekhidna sp.]|uniref:outer membrane beta-barrel protein n=1 Tax=Ekhidna sp. TaxID=2608089 RepID=UPI0032EE43E8
MKKFTILSVFAALLLVGTTANAQEQGDMSINAGVGIATGAFGGDESTTGFGGGFEYVFMDAMSGTVEYYSYTKDSFTASAIGIDYKYYFMTDAFKVFGKAGLTMLGGDVDSTMGLNLGLGGVYGISDQFGIGAGLDYNLAKPDGAEDPFGLIIKFGVSYSF